MQLLHHLYRRASGPFRSMVLVAIALGWLAIVITPTPALAVSYNRAAAVNWASSDNFRDADFHGYSLGRWCTNYVARALAAGGLNTGTDWIGNQQIVYWMLNNPNSWEFRDPSQLEAGDFVLYSDQAEAPGDWAYIFPGGFSRWGHVALVISSGRVASWNAEYWDVPINWFTTLPYRVGVHIRTDGGTSNPGYAHQGTLFYGATQVRTLNGEQRWQATVQANHNPILFDLNRRSGTGSYQVLLKNAAGAVLIDTRASVNGRAIVTYPNATNEVLYLHVIPDAGVTLEYEVTVWATSIPMVRYEWTGGQDAYFDSNTARWQAPVGTDQSFWFEFERYSGDLEIDWRLQTRGGQVLATGTSSNGHVIAPGYGSNWMDFYITGHRGSGSYKIWLKGGVPQPGTPTIGTPALASTVEKTFMVKVQAGPTNGNGAARFHVQVDNDSGFASPEFDNGANPSTTTTIPVTVTQSGEYFLRVRQLDAGSGASPFTAPMPFVVENPAELQLKAEASETLMSVGENITVDFVLEHPELAGGGGVYALESTCTTQTSGMVTAQTLLKGSVFSPDPAIISNLQANNEILYAVSQSGSNAAISTSGKVFSATFQGVQPGKTLIDCDVTAIDATNTTVTVAYKGIELTVETPIPTTGIVSGKALRSHAVDSGIAIALTDSAGTVVANGTTSADGSFSIPDIPTGRYTIKATSPSYLSAQGQVNVVAGQTATLPTVTLLAGDLAGTSPVVIDELDVIQLASTYGQQVPPAPVSSDLTLDGVVSLGDLRALAENLRKTGPIVWQ